MSYVLVLYYSRGGATAEMAGHPVGLEGSGVHGECS